MRTRSAVLIAALLLSACVGPPKKHREVRYQPPPETAERYHQCVALLRAEGSQVDELPDRRFDNGCSATSAVKLVAIGIPVTNLGAVKCGLAIPFARWVRQDVQAQAAKWLDGYVTKIESFGSFVCRPINNVEGNKLSEHGKANAIDVGAFQLKDGRRITIKQGWNGDDPKVRGFLRALHKAACGRFIVVLGPEENALHADHFHFDMGSWHYCR